MGSLQQGKNVLITELLEREKLLDSIKWKAAERALPGICVTRLVVGPVGYSPWAGRSPALHLALRPLPRPNNLEESLGAGTGHALSRGRSRAL